MAENMVTKELLDNLFSVRPLYNKLRTVNNGRPIPPLSSSITPHETKTDQCTRHFFHLCV
jgi:hypothetical protein